MAYLQRQRAADLGLGEAELIVTRRELDELRDAIYVVECAVEDVERDVTEAGDDPGELKRSLDWLLQAVRPLIEHPPLTAP